MILTVIMINTEHLIRTIIVLGIDEIDIAIIVRIQSLAMVMYVHVS